MSKLKYGNSSTYSFEMSQADLDTLSSKYNRSKNQLLFLFQLVDGDFEKLELLESKLKSKHFYFCPDTKEEVDYVLL